MFLPDPLASGHQLDKDVSIYSRVLLPALAALVPTAVGALFKWAQDHSFTRRRVELSDRMAALVKLIAEMPEVAVDAAGETSNPRAILTGELVFVSHELAALQTKVGKHVVVSSATNRVRSALLLYRPHGALAWLLHGFFFLYMGLLGYGLIDLIATTRDSDFRYGLIGFTVLGIPPLFIRYFAARLHRTYCASLQPRVAPPAVLPASQSATVVPPASSTTTPMANGA